MRIEHVRHHILRDIKTANASDLAPAGPEMPRDFRENHTAFVCLLYHPLWESRLEH